jgi:hypothetical protein
MIFISFLKKGSVFIKTNCKYKNKINKRLRLKYWSSQTCQITSANRLTIFPNSIEVLESLGRVKRHSERLKA